MHIPKVDSASDERCEETNAEVPDPVAGSGKSHTLRTVSRREDFCLNGPNHGTPSSGKAKNEETGENDEYNTGCGGSRGIVKIKHEMTNGGEDQEANEHPNGTGNERLATTKVLNHVQTNEGDTKVDTVENDLSDKRVDLHRLEDGGTVVEEVVGTGKLLEHLQSHTKGDTISHAGSSEHADKLLDGAKLDLVFSAELALNFCNLSVDSPVVFRCTVYTANGLLGSLLMSVSEVVSRSLWEEQNTESKDESPDPSQANDDSPTARVAALVLDGAVVEAGSEPDAHGDEELVSANHGTSNPGGCCLSLVHGNKQTQSANT